MCSFELGSPAHGSVRVMEWVFTTLLHFFLPRRIASRPYQPTYISIKLVSLAMAVFCICFVCRDALVYPQISVSNLDPSTGTISLVAAGPSLDYSLFNQSVNDAGACTCTNAVLQVVFARECSAVCCPFHSTHSQADYVVSMASPNVISSVSLSVVLADLSTGSVVVLLPFTELDFRYYLVYGFPGVPPPPSLARFLSRTNLQGQRMV